ncbi:hypothetical protein [Polycladidibacter hongkongensis]|uniref:hypothetical protein n=1 Tax=Polycladidibacter hongkongensis TaxID=1647556 RepID=UPI00082D30FD|nr:hypothetical protein [Pseudovibrio hongkongensis]
MQSQNKMIVISLLSGLACLNSGNASVLECSINDKNACLPDKGCKSISASVYNVVDWDNQKYARCDRYGCDHYDYTSFKSGIFENIVIQGKSVVARIDMRSKQFSEIASLGLTTYVSFGTCKEIAQ